MKLYVISTKYQHLVSVNMEPRFGKKPISKKNVSNHALQATFNASKTDALIAFNDKEMAQEIMCLFLKGHNTTPDFIEAGVLQFAVPVIYTVELDEATLPAQTTLTIDDLVTYADTRTIPLYLNYSGLEEIEKQRMSKALQELPEPLKIRKLNGLRLENVVEATYLKSDMSSFVSSDITTKPSVNMQVLSGFIAALGIAAVAVSFCVLNAATLGIAGVIVAAIGVTATLLGGIGLFKYAPAAESDNYKFCNMHA